MLQRLSRLDTRAFYLSLLTSIHLPAPIDLIGKECTYGRHSLDARALERNQLARFAHRHLILMRGAPLPHYCRTLLLLVGGRLLGGILSRDPRKCLSFMGAPLVARNFLSRIVQELIVHFRPISAKHGQIQKQLTVPSDFPVIFRDLRQIDPTDISEETIHILR
jgi:hypothetical protein